MTQAAYLRDAPDAVATLARLRRAVPRGHSFDTDAWDAFGELPETLRGRGDQLSAGEFSAIAALSLHALHQQSRRDAAMHVRDRDRAWGRSVGELQRRDGGQGVQRRFRALLRADDPTSGLQHIRGLVSQLRGHLIPTDYAGLAADLFLLHLPASRHSVRMRWARDYHYGPTTTAASRNDQIGETS